MNLSLCKYSLNLHILKYNTTVAYIIALGMVCIKCVCLFEISHGRNWARIATLILAILTCLVALLCRGDTHTPIICPLYVGGTAIYAIAAILLFLKPSSDWFKQMKAGVDFEQG